MQSKYIKMLSDEQRVCRACEYEDSPNAGKSDDLRYFNEGIYHPTCYDEVGALLKTLNENNVPKDKAIEMFMNLGINLEIISVDGVPATKLTDGYTTTTV